MEHGYDIKKLRYSGAESISILCNYRQLSDFEVPSSFVAALGWLNQLAFLSMFLNCEILCICMLF